MVGLYVYSGKGGAGATTCAAATAREYAHRGHETALVSLDPTNSLSDRLDTAIGPEPTLVEPGLTAVEISPEAGQETYRDCFDQLSDVASVAGIDLGDGHVPRLVGDTRLPFGRELAALEAVASFVGDAGFDVVVFDTGLEGRILRLLRRPSLLGVGVDVASMAASELHDHVDGAVESVLDPVSSGGDREPGGPQQPAVHSEQLSGAETEAIESRIARVREVLGGDGDRELRVVTTPDRVDAQWTERLVVNLQNAGIPAGPLVVNKVLQEGNCCARCATRRADQERVLRELRGREELDFLVLPDCAGTVAGDAMLDRLAEDLVS